MAKCEVSIANSPATPITSKGTILSAVVRTWNRPAARTPITLSPVSSQTMAMAMVRGDRRRSHQSGDKGVEVTAKATASAASDDQHEIQ